MTISSEVVTHIVYPADDAIGGTGTFTLLDYPRSNALSPQENLLLDYPRSNSLASGNFTATFLYPLIRTFHVVTPTGPGAWAQRWAKTKTNPTAGLDLTVSAGRRMAIARTDLPMMVVGVIVRHISSSAVTSNAIVGVGTQEGEDDLLPATPLSGLASNAPVRLMAFGYTKVVQPADEIWFNVITAATATSQMAHVDLITLPLPGA